MKFKKYVVSLSSIVMVSLLTACDLGSSSSNAGQEFTLFAPNVEAVGTAATPSNVIDTSSTVTEPTPTTPITPTASVETNAVTTTDTNAQISSRSLAGTGIVWKPVSEGDGKLVILTPTSYGQPEVTVLNSSGGAVESGRYVGHTNGNRATYRFSRGGSGYSAPAYLRVGNTVFLVSSPSSRYN